MEDLEIELGNNPEEGSIYRCHVEVDAEVIGRKMHQEYWTEVRLITLCAPPAANRAQDTMKQ